jgi:hypothetical protein
MAAIPRPRRRNLILETRYGKYFWLPRYNRVLYYRDGKIADRPTWSGTLNTVNNTEQGATQKAAAHEYHRLQAILFKEA